MGQLSIWVGRKSMKVLLHSHPGQSVMISVMKGSKHLLQFLAEPEHRVHPALHDSHFRLT